jgi:hypothetical protein
VIPRPGAAARRPPAGTTPRVSDLDPVRRPGEFVFVVAVEGVTVVTAPERADDLGLAYDYGLRHDHLLVPADRADEALAVLRGLRR